MVGPQHLRAVGEDDRFKRLPARMRRGERVVTGRVPILRQHHILKPLSQAADDRRDFVATRNRKAAPRTEIILNVHHQQDVSGADCEPVSHCCLPEDAGASS
jgi:hypothetical protein